MTDRITITVPVDLWPAHNYIHPVTGGQLDRCRFCGCTRHQDAA